MFRFFRLSCAMSLIASYIFLKLLNLTRVTRQQLIKALDQTAFMKLHLDGTGNLPMACPHLSTAEHDKVVMVDN